MKDLLVVNYEKFQGKKFSCVPQGKHETETKQLKRHCSGFILDVHNVKLCEF